MHFYDIVQIIQKRVGNAANVCGFGHLGDSNLHLNVLCDEFTPEIQKLVEPFVFEYTSQVQGSISSEHGIGFLKSKYLHYSKDKQAITQMQQIKDIMDPKGILNPYKLLPGIKRL